jgi:hypothetical protein
VPFGFCSARDRLVLLLWRLAFAVLALVSLQAEFYEVLAIVADVRSGWSVACLSGSLVRPPVAFDLHSPAFQRPYIETASLIHLQTPFSFHGLTATGSAGLINTISMLSQSHVLSGVFGVITSVGWAVQTVFGGWLYKRVWDFKNNNEGISFQNVSRGFGFCYRKAQIAKETGSDADDLMLTMVFVLGLQATNQFKAESFKTVVLHQSRI